MDLDDELMKLGKFNRRRILIYCLVCTSVTVSGCWHMMSIMFTGGEPIHHCKLQEGETENGSIPWEPVTSKGKTRWRYAQCTRYPPHGDQKNNLVDVWNGTGNGSVIPCPNGWYYDQSEFQSTIMTEWDLVCDRNYLVETSQSVFNGGVMMGAIVFTSLADSVGRKPVHLTCQYLMLILGIFIAFSPNYIIFVILRFIQGAVREGTGLVGIVMACELFPAVHRTFAGAALELFWAAGWMALALIAYLIRDWRHLQIAITLPALWTICLIWILPESVPWLVANNRIDEAENILIKLVKPLTCGKASTSKSLSAHRPSLAAIRESNKYLITDAHANKDVTSSNAAMGRQNNVGVVGRIGKRINAINSSVRFYLRGRNKTKEMKTQLTFIDLIKSRKMVLYTFIMCSLWFASGIVYFGLSLSTSSLAGDKYINFFLSGAVEAPAYGMTVYVLQRFGRRWPLFVFHAVASVALFVNIFIPNETEGGTDLTPLIITLTMIGKFSMTASFGTAVLYAPEIYPTNLRNLGFGLASCCGRIGGMIAPFFAYIGKTNDWIPGVVFTCTAFVTGALVLLLPETLNRPLPDTIEEIEAWSRDAGAGSPPEAKKLKILKNLKTELIVNRIVMSCMRFREIV